MSDAANAAQQAAKLMTELKTNAQLMTLEEGTYCILQNPSQPGETAGGLPGVRVSLPPGPLARPDAVRIATFRPDGWMVGGEAALVAIRGGTGHVLVTVYQAPDAPVAAAPHLQVMRLFSHAAGIPPAAAAPLPPAPPAAVPVPPPPADGPAAGPADLLAHIQSSGDVGGHFGVWLGERGSKKWIEGFAIAPVEGVPVTDIEYQAVLGRGWLSPWVEGGQFCGSRGMALPILGLKVRLRGASAETHRLEVSATFVDGAAVGPVGSGEACEAESLSPVEAMLVSVLPREGAAGKGGHAKAASGKPAARGR